MPLNKYNQCVPSSRLKKSLRQLIPRYLLSAATEHEIKFMLQWLNFMQQFFDQSSYLANGHPRFPSKWNIDAWDPAQQEDPAYWIDKGLKKLMQDRNEENRWDDEGWTRCGMSEAKVMIAIRDLWCDELERILRVGIIFLCLQEQHPAEVLLIKYRKSGEMRYGFPKGKPYFGKTDIEGAIREAAEECGVKEALITAYIDYGSRIKRNVYMKSMNSSVEHYYYVVPVPNKEMEFKPQQGEIEAVEWRPVNMLPCSLKCRFVQKGTCAENYFMVLCKEQSGGRSLVYDVLDYMCQKRGTQDAITQYEETHRSCSNKEPLMFSARFSKSC